MVLSPASVFLWSESLDVDRGYEAAISHGCHTAFSSPPAISNLNLFQNHLSKKKAKAQKSSSTCLVDSGEESQLLTVQLPHRFTDDG